MNAEAHGRRILPWLALALLASCSASPPPPPVDVASTTSIVDTGLADGLAKRFLARSRMRMRIRAVGSGQAFALGRAGEADLILAHDPEGLVRFRRDGFEDSSRAFARNDFVLAGPPGDPAGAAGAPDLGDAFLRVAGRAPFVSRGDGSGTNARELQIWASEHVHGGPSGDWYLRTGQGMAETLRIADEKSAYVLTDSATFALVSPRLRLKVILARGPGRENVYVATVVRYEGDTSGAAWRFLTFLAQPSTKAYIASFGPGRPLFRAP